MQTKLQHLNLLTFFILSLIWPPFKVTCSDTVFGPLGQIYMLCVCLVKNSPQKPSGKKIEEKSTSQALLMLHMLPR